MNATYENYAIGTPVRERPAAQTMDELQAQVDGFLAKHPIPEDAEKTARIDAILTKMKFERARNAR